MKKAWRIGGLVVIAGTLVSVVACRQTEVRRPGSSPPQMPDEAPKGGKPVAVARPAGAAAEAKVAAALSVMAPTMADQKPVDLVGLHNVVAYREGFFSGGVPEGEEAFATLAALGVKTVISVDGAAPNLEAARKHGLRYVHLPIGYNGFSETRKLELVRATRDAMGEGPVYLHCHHGKHRSAGAAAAVAQSLGWMNVEEGQARMKVSGTAAGYTGLYACAAESSVLDMAVIDSVPADFPSVQPPKGIVKSMVEMDEVFDQLKLIEKAGWVAPRDHPDLVPAAVAGRLADLFRNVHADDSTGRRPREFAEWLKADEARAAGMEETLASGGKDSGTLSAEMKVLGASCMGCHGKYRD